MDDPFQEGEYLTWAPSTAETRSQPAPVLIHGGLDVWPAVACPGDHRILCVRAINAGLYATALGLLVTLLGLVAGFGTWTALLASLPTLILVLGLGGAQGSPIAQHQGTPSLRDLGVLAGLCLMVHAARRLDDGRVTRAAFAILGALATVAPLWAYNRGLVLALVSVLFTLATCATARTPRPAVAALAGAVLAAIALLALGAWPSILQAATDIPYWLRNAGLWQSGGSRRARALTLLMHAFALGVAAPAAWRAWRAGRRAPGLILLALTGTATLYVHQALGRPDAIHLRWTLWIATVLLGLGLREWMAWPSPIARIAAPAAAAAAVLVAAVAAYSLADTPPNRWRVLPGLRANARLLHGPAPTDRMLAGDDLMRVADIVRATGRCTFAANNAGLVHLLSGMPPCSRFAYGNYIAPAHQAQVIAELEAARPRVIIWSASPWWANVDGRGFAQNSPDIAAWIMRHYPVETTIGPQTLRSLTPLDASHSRASDAATATTAR